MKSAKAAELYLMINIAGLEAPPSVYQALITLIQEPETLLDALAEREVDPSWEHHLWRVLGWTATRFVYVEIRDPVGDAMNTARVDVVAAWTRARSDLREIRIVGMESRTSDFGDDWQWRTRLEAVIGDCVIQVPDRSSAATPEIRARSNQFANDLTAMLG